MSVTKPRIFIPSGAGAPGFGGIFQCLKQGNFAYVVAGDSNEHAYGQALADQFYLMPPSSDEENYLSKVKQIILDEKIDLVLPITTRELSVLAKYRFELQALGVKVVVSDLKKLTIANNKALLKDCAENQHIPVPKGSLVKSWSQFENEASRLLSEGYKVCFKPSEGNGSRGLGFVCIENDLNYSINKPGEIWMTLSEWRMRLEKAFNDDLQLLLTEYLPGKEYSVDALVYENKILLCVPRSRDKMVGGISVAGVIEKNETLIELTKKLILSLDLEGPIGVQWRADEQGNYKLLEVNPRLQGTTSALLLAGVNVPQKTAKQYLELDDSEIDEPIWGTRFSRYWKDVGISYYLRDHYE
jgi:carbamoyl-phosphate synthase large subunit